MGNLIKQKIEKITTREGEIEVTINLNLHISLDKNEQINIETKNTEITKKELIKEDDKINMEIPEIECNEELLEFGQEIE